MRVIITGGSGLIGSHLARSLGNDGHQIIVLSRDSQRNRIPAGAQGVRWDGSTPRGWGHLIDKDTAIINLAGEPIRAFRWSERHKQRILGTRIEVARAVLQAVKDAREKPRVIIQPSSTGYFGDRGDEILTDASGPGSGFRADACKLWERGVPAGDTRRVIARMGFVLSPDGGFLPAMRFAALMGGKQFGTGQQYISWVHLEDVIAAIRFFMLTDSTSGVYNVTAPQPCTNAEFMTALHSVTHLPSVLEFRDWMINAALGKEQAVVVTDSQRVIPERLTQAGFRFKYTEIEWTLRQLLRGSGR
ncbi:MAG: TIGR01777 family protein [Anaerolinea sp.]|mgnify:CR=1 FL=1|nr:TIGR01777 family protein [Anaerolinea sp.]